MQNTYIIHNTTRLAATRDLRRLVPGPAGSSKNIIIGGASLRIVRGRPVPVTETFLRRHLREIADKESKGLLAVYTPNSKRVNLVTLEAIPNSPPPPAIEVDVEEQPAPVHTAPTEPPPAVEVELAAAVPDLEVSTQAETVAELDSPSFAPANEAPTNVEQSNPFFKGKKNRR